MDNIQNLFALKKKFLNYKDIEYIPIDFEEIMMVLVNRIKENLPNTWTDFLESNHGMEILEVIAYEAMLLAFNVNKNVNELFLPTARTRDAIYRLVKLVGYKPKPPTPAKVNITFYLDKPHNEQIVIPKYTKLSNDFYTTERAILYPGQLSLDVSAIGGVLYEEEFLATGTVGYKYPLSHSPVSFIESVEVNNEVYEYLDLIDRKELKPYYTTLQDIYFNTHLVFGDGLYGINPKKGTRIKVKYNVTEDGSKTNVKQFTITSISDTIYDSTGRVVDLKCFNKFDASGGDTEEKLDEIKRNAPSIFRTQQRAVTRQDFKDWVLSLPGIAKCVVIDHLVDNSVGIYGVKIGIIPEGGGLPTLGLMNYVNKFLQDKKTITSVVEVIKPYILPVDINVVIQIDENKDTNVVLNKVRGEIFEYLSWKNRDFGDPVSAADIYKLISEVDGVTFADNLKIIEQKKIYLLERPTNLNNIKILDTLNIIKNGSKISICNNENKIIHNTEVVNFDGNDCELKDPISEKYIETLEYGSKVFPVLKTAKIAHINDKKIRIQDTKLLNLSNTLIAFENDMDLHYTISYRTDNDIYLDTPLDKTIYPNTNIYVIAKDPKPKLSQRALKGSSVLSFKERPRFTTSAIISPQKKFDYNVNTVSLRRNYDNYDVITYDHLNIIEIRKVYIDPEVPFTYGIDYSVNDNRMIVWLKPDKIPLGTTYFVDFVKKTIMESESGSKYYVKKVNDKDVELNSPLLMDLDENEVFEVESDSLNLYDYEISDAGNIKIEVV